MAQTDDLKLEGARITAFSPIAARTERDGSVKEEAKLNIAFAVEVDTVTPHMNRLTRLYRKRRSITIGFSGVNAKGGELTAFSPKAARVSPDGDEVSPPMMAVVFRFDLEPLEDSKIGKIAELYRIRKDATLSIEAIEQLELSASRKDKLEDEAQAKLELNGHSPASDKDVAAGKTKAVSTAKGAKKKRVHQPV